MRQIGTPHDIEGDTIRQAKRAGIYFIRLAMPRNKNGSDDGGLDFTGLGT